MKTREFTPTDSNTTSHGRIQFLDSMRAIAIIMVVGVHSLSYCLPLPASQKEVIAFIFEIPVQLFFLVDGYLFAMHISSARKYNYIEHIYKSIKRLLFPWLIFTLLYLFVRYYFELSGYLTDKYVVGHSLKEIIISAYGSVYSAQMYFLISLFLIRLLNPIFKKIIFTKSYPVVIFLFICVLILYDSTAKFIDPFLYIRGGEEPVTHALWGIQFYFLGMILFRTPAILKFEKIFIPLILLLLIAMAFYNGLSQEHYGRIFIQYLYLLSFFLLFAHVGNKLPFLNVIGTNTMGIYLVHAPILIKIVSVITNKIIYIPPLNYIVILSVTFTLSIFVVIMIKKIPYGPLLFGETVR